MPGQSPLPARPATEALWPLMALAVIVLLGAWLRFSRLDLMEFKQDEWRLHQLAVRQAHGEWQFGGLMSSVGVSNPPMAVYLFSLPALISPSPLLMACLPALLNTLAIALLYRLARQWMSPGASLAAALLFAVSPWAVIESRKIWAQDLLPFFAVAFVLCAVEWLRRGRWTHAAGMALSLAILNQVHYSSLALWPILLFVLWRRHARRDLKQAAFGAVLFIVLWVPFLVLVARGELRDPRPYSAVHSESRTALTELAQGVIWQGRLMGHGAFDIIAGSPVAESATMTAVLLCLLAAGLAAAILRTREQPDLWILIMWLALPLLWCFHGTFFHYFIGSSPAGFLLVGTLGDLLWDRLRKAGGKPALQWAATVAMLLCLAVVAAEGAAFLRWFFDTVSTQGGTPGDYGIAYREKRLAAQYLAKESPSESFVLIDLTHRYPESDTYEYLYRLEGGRGQRLSPASVRPVALRPTVFVLLSPWAEGRMKADPAVLRDEGIVPVGRLRVQTLRPAMPGGNR